MEFLQNQPHIHGIYLRRMSPQPDLTVLKFMEGRIRFQVRLQVPTQVHMVLEGRLRFQVLFQVFIRMVLEYLLVANLQYPCSIRLLLPLFRQLHTRAPILRPIRILGQWMGLHLLHIIPRMTNLRIPLLRHTNVQCRVHRMKE
jgi:hypothetical protein